MEPEASPNPKSDQQRAIRADNRSRDVSVAEALRHCTPELLRQLFPITEKQSQVLRHFLENPNEQRVARLLGISPKTVSNHLDSIRKTLNFPCRMELIQHVLICVLK